MAEEIGATYINPMSFTDFYNSYGRGRVIANGSGSWNDHDPYSIAGWWNNLLYGTRTSAEKDYQNYLSRVEGNNNEFFRKQADKDTWAREDTAPERMVESYKKAGLNPYSLTGSALSMSVNSSPSDRSTYSRASKSEKKEEGKLSSLALKLLAVLVLKKVL